MKAKLQKRPPRKSRLAVFAALDARQLHHKSAATWRAAASSRCAADERPRKGYGRRSPRFVRKKSRTTTCKTTTCPRVRS